MNKVIVTILAFVTVLLLFFSASLIYQRSVVANWTSAFFLIWEKELVSEVMGGQVGDRAGNNVVQEPSPLFRKLVPFIQSQQPELSHLHFDSLILEGERKENQAEKHPEGQLSCSFRHSIELKLGGVPSARVSYCIEVQKLVQTLFKDPYFLSVFGLLLAFGGLVIFLQMKLVERARLIEESDQLKQKLFIMGQRAAHDIRSPLSALVALKEELSPSGEAKVMVDQVVERIQMVAEDLLEAGREHRMSSPIETQKNGDFQFQSILKSFGDTTMDGRTMNHDMESQTDASRVFQEIADGVRSLCHSIGRAEAVMIEFSPSVDEGNEEKKSLVNLIEIKDQNASTRVKSKIIRISENLIRNSIQAQKNDRKLMIKVEVFRTSSDLFVKVQDNGIGMSQEQVVGSLNGISYRPGGHGMGISGAHEELRAMGGQLEIFSKVDHGTLVTLRLPLTALSRSISDI